MVRTRSVSPRCYPLFTRRNPDTVRGADVLYISNERFALQTPGHAFLDVAPERRSKSSAPTTTPLREIFRD